MRKYYHHLGATLLHFCRGQLILSLWQLRDGPPLDRPLVAASSRTLLGMLCVKTQAKLARTPEIFLKHGESPSIGVDFTQPFKHTALLLWNCSFYASGIYPFPCIDLWDCHIVNSEAQKQWTGWLENKTPSPVKTEWINMLCCNHIMEYYTAEKINEPQLYKTTWLILENVVRH